MPPLQRAKLSITADPDGDGVDETGVFEMVGDLETRPNIEPAFIVGGRGSLAISLLSELAGAGESKRKQFFIEAGAGARTVEFAFRGWKGAIDESGSAVQWGDSSTVERTKTNATGQDPITQIDVLMKYLETAEIDSRKNNLATLEYGEFSTDGLYSPLDVVVRGPTMSRVAEDGSWFRGEMTCIAAADLDDLWDAAEQFSF